MVTTARHAVTGRVSGAKDTVSDTLSTVVDRTRGAVQGGMERTRAMVSGSVSTVLESRVARLVSSSVDSALSTSESLVEQYLPLTEDELGEWAETGQGVGGGVWGGRPGGAVAAVADDNYCPRLF